jgi:hypothetical protein
MKLSKLHIPLLTTLLLAACNLAVAKDESSKPAAKSWEPTLTPQEEAMSAMGRNRFFILEPGYQLVYQGKEGGQTVELVITVLDETKQVAGTETRIVEERESAGGKLVEVSRNYFACGAHSHNVYYLGEDVDMYKDGKIASHDGSWLAGVGDAKHGIAMPAENKVGDKYYQEQSPKVAQDRAETVSVTDKVKSPAGTFENCIKVKETTPLEPGTEYKWYAPEIGLVADGDLKLVKHGFPKKDK